MIGFPKTTGSKGIHVYVRVEPGWDSFAVRGAVIALARELARRHPDLITDKWWKEERGERVFIDFNQMARDRTIASAYSVRPTTDARVSAPLTWDELADAAPEDFTVRSMPARFAALGDVWAPFYAQPPGTLDAALELYDRDVAELGTGKAGGAEMPYPPDYPKMPGEPPRVQPSKKVAEHWDAEGNRIEP